MDEIQEKLNISGTVDHIIYQNNSNGYVVFILDTNEEKITVVATYPELYRGDKVDIIGSYVYHSIYGRQFKADSVVPFMPENLNDLYQYLSEGGIKGIGSAIARKIIDKFGENTFDILENYPEKLVEIKGISRNKAIKISDEYQKQFNARTTLLSLASLGLTTQESFIILNKFGVDAHLLIKENPYLLCLQDIGFSFERTEQIAQILPEKSMESNRVEACLIYTMRHNLANGHTCVPTEKLIKTVAAFLENTKDNIEIVLDNTFVQGYLIEKEINKNNYTFLPEAYFAENHIADKILLLLNSKKKKVSKSKKSKDNIEYAELQKEAIKIAKDEGILILTGGPGTGKTTTLKGIIDLFELSQLRVSLCAPTGRAAQRMTEATGREAMTIHRMLEVDFGDNDKMYFKRNSKKPLESDVIIVDEMSMVDIFLFDSLLDAISAGSRLILVGDSNQLPSVNAGNVLKDLISSKLLPTVELTEIFRQASESNIVMNAHYIVNGQKLNKENFDKDFFLMDIKNPIEASRTIIDLYTNRLPNSIGLRPQDQIQILCPSKMGELGIYSLNAKLQEKINPPAKHKKEIKTAYRIFREGDKVMQIKNNYHISWVDAENQGEGVYNGDIGIIEHINHSLDNVVINFNGKRADYSLEEMQQLELAYAVTVHKSQGSEFDAVIIPVIFVNSKLCYRNLLYTAVTRARNLLIIVGTKDAVNKMIENNKAQLRYSSLQYLILDKNL